MSSKIQHYKQTMFLSSRDMCERGLWIILADLGQARLQTHEYELQNGPILGGKKINIQPIMNHLEDFGGHSSFFNVP